MPEGLLSRRDFLKILGLTSLATVSAPIASRLSGESGRELFFDSFKQFESYLNQLIRTRESNVLVNHNVMQFFLENMLQRVKYHGISNIHVMLSTDPEELIDNTALRVDSDTVNPAVVNEMIKLLVQSAVGTVYGKVAIVSESYSVVSGLLSSVTRSFQNLMVPKNYVCQSVLEYQFYGMDGSVSQLPPGAQVAERLTVKFDLYDYQYRVPQNDNFGWDSLQSRYMPNIYVAKILENRTGTHPVQHTHRNFLSEQYRGVLTFNSDFFGIAINPTDAETAFTTIYQNYLQ